TRPSRATATGGQTPVATGENPHRGPEPLGAGHRRRHGRDYPCQADRLARPRSPPLRMNGRAESDLRRARPGSPSLLLAVFTQWTMLGRRSRSTLSAKTLELKAAAPALGCNRSD